MRRSPPPRNGLRPPARKRCPGACRRSRSSARGTTATRTSRRGSGRSPAVPSDLRRRSRRRPARRERRPDAGSRQFHPRDRLVVPGQQSKLHVLLLGEPAEQTPHATKHRPGEIVGDQTGRPFAAAAAHSIGACVDPVRGDAGVEQDRARDFAVGPPGRRDGDPDRGWYRLRALLAKQRSLPRPPAAPCRRAAFRRCRRVEARLWGRRSLVRSTRDRLVSERAQVARIDEPAIRVVDVRAPVAVCARGRKRPASRAVASDGSPA